MLDWNNKIIIDLDWGTIMGIAMLCITALLLWGCTYTPPREPIIRYETISVDRYVGLRLAHPMCQSHPDIMPFPVDGTIEEMQAWAIMVGELRDNGRELDAGCIAAYWLLIDTINDHADIIDKGWVPDGR